MSTADLFSHTANPVAIRFKPISPDKLSLWRRQSLIVIRLNSGGPH
jgi:hypothetical protein